MAQGLSEARCCCWKPELPPKPGRASSIFLLAVPPSSSYLPSHLCLFLLAPNAVDGD